MVILLLLGGCAHPTVCRVHVTDTSGTPVPEAEVTVGWSWSYDPSGMTSPKSRSRTGRADSAGNYTFLGMTKGGIGVSASKEGYYRTFAGSAEKQPVVVELRRQLNPIPMYAKDAKIDLPSGGGAYAYDLFVGDLVAPHGVGIVTDMIFHIQTTTTNWRDRTIYYLHGDVTFPNANDGLQAFFVPNRVHPESEYRLPLSAPSDGYAPSLVDANGNTEEVYREYGDHHTGVDSLPKPWYWTDKYAFRDPIRSWMEEVNYFLRIRSNSERGACYGVVRGMFRFGYRGDNIPYIEFGYFANPDHSQNIEYDPKQNLLTEFRRYKLWEYSPGYP
jgi:hypothetical protein